MILQNRKKEHLVIAICLLFIFSYIFLQIFAFFIMGQGDNSYWIFDPDNLYRLTHVWQVLKSDRYPPDSLSNLGVSYHYHYGGPAIAAFLSELTDFPADEVYFRFALPLMLLGAVFLVFISVYSYSKNKMLAIISIAILLLSSLNSAVGINPEKLYGRSRSALHDLILGLWHWDITEIMSGSAAKYAFWFGNGVFDIAYLSLYLIMAITLNIAFLKKSYNRLLSIILLFPFLFLLKSEAIIIGFLLLMVEVGLQVLFKFGWKGVLSCCAVFLMIILLYSFSEGVINFPNAQLILGISSNNYFSISYAFFSFFYVLMFVDLVYNDSNDKSCYVAMFFLLTICFFVLDTFVDVEMIQDGVDHKTNLNYYFITIKQAIYVVGIVLYFVVRELRERNIGINIILSIISFLFILTIMFKTYHAIIQSFILMANPSERYESVDFMHYRECLEKVPVSQSVLYTNYFEYPDGIYSKGTTDMALHLSAFFGHQAYAANSAFENYPLTVQRVAEQKRILGRIDTSLLDVCSLMKKGGGVGYAIFDKNGVFPLSTKPHFLFENKKCAVFFASNSICK